MERSFEQLARIWLDNELFGKQYSYQKAELESRLHRSMIKSVLLFGVCVFFLFAAFLFYFSDDQFWFYTSVIMCAIALFAGYNYIVCTPENKINVEGEIKSAIQDMYGNREFLLDAHHLGRILSVISTSLSVSYGQAEICLLFECQTDGKTVEPYTLKVTLTKTSDINYQGTLLLDLEHGTGTCYYKDISCLKDITKNDVEFEVVNQFLPKGRNQ